MTVYVRDILALVNGIAPFSLAETWDNSGLQAGDPAWKASRVMVCLDVTPGVMAEAKAACCDVLVSHHPLTMSGVKSLDFSQMPGQVVAAAARDRIAVISAHTNLDKAEKGLNDYFAHKIGIPCNGPFLTQGDPDRPWAGLGRMGVLDPALSLEALVSQIKKALGVSRLRVVGALGTQVRDVALCTGSGGSLTGHFLLSPAQVYITGDLKYHEARDIEAAGKAAVDVGHFASEAIVTELLKNRLESQVASMGCALGIVEYKKEEDPFIFI